MYHLHIDRLHVATTARLVFLM